MNRTFFLLLGTSALLLLQSCNVKKFVPEDELLYTGGQAVIKNETEIENIGSIQEKITEVLRPNPNGKFLGMRPGLYFYYKANQENPSFIYKFLNKKFGEEPVYASSVQLDEVEEIIMNRLENNGYFYSEISSDLIEHREVKEAEAVYTVELEDPYVMADSTYNVLSDSLLVYREIIEMQPSPLITPQMRFNLTVMKAERQRIDNNLKQEGYYFFNPEFLLFEADTNQYNKKRFDLFLRLKKEVPKAAIIPYKIARVNVFPNYNVEVDSTLLDTTFLNDKYFIQTDNYFEPKNLEPYILIEAGELYNPLESQYTSRRLASLGTYKFVNIRYDVIDSLTTDSIGYLEANIFLSPLTRRSIRAELQGVTKSNDFLGPRLSLSYANRNLFHGGEILGLTGQVGYEWQAASGSSRSLSSTVLGFAADVVVPRMLFPVNINTDWFKYSIPKTRFSLAANFLNRSDLYQMYSFSGRIGYFWDSNRYVTHEFNPISVDYSKLGKTTTEFQTILTNNPYLQRSFEQQFIAGFLYSFTYNGMVDLLDTHQFFFNGNLDVAGNTLSLLSKSGEEGAKTFLGQEYAQYVKIDGDFRYHYRLGAEQKIATRLFAGFGNPYGNSDVMPFSRQYFAGGPYSIRAFRIRSLGPGTFNPEDGDGTFFDQAGNVKLEANVEYRFPIYSFFKGAVFVDAGNVWHTGNVDYLPDDVGKFSGDFLNELAVGAGVGLRIDIQNFIIRFDLAAPMRTPWLREGERWNFDFGSPVLNFAIGYPF